MVGGGLAGLSCALYLQKYGAEVLLLERNDYLGGRTASWNQDGMLVESGLHRFLGFFSELPKLLKMAGIKPNDILFWEDEIIIMMKGQKPASFGLAPFFKPFKTIAGVLGNTHFLTPGDKFRLVKFFIKGMADCVRNPLAMDTMSISEYAKKHDIPDKLILRIIVPLSAGLFFLPPHEYSAFVFFGLFVPFVPRAYKARVGAFRGGMTNVMATPLGNQIAANGGIVMTGNPVERLLLSDNRVNGVSVEGKEYLADHVVLATSLAPAQRLLQQTFPTHPWFAPMFRLPTMPSVTLQLELSERATEKDRTTFAPETALGAFSEQSHSTFTHVPGRLSIILTPPEKFIDMPGQEILDYAIDDAERLGILLRDKILNYRVVIEPEEFYRLTPGSEKLKPSQETPISGLTLAGDYTKQKYLATMEGAVYSGKLAAKTTAKHLKC